MSTNSHPEPYGPVDHHRVRVEEAVDCAEPEHWFDQIVGWPGKHDGGLPEDPKKPCRTFAEVYG